MVNNSINEIDDFVDELKKDRDLGKKLAQPETRQELHVEIVNKLQNLLFSIDRVENNIQYQSDVYYEDILLAIRDIEDLENKHQAEWIEAIKKAVEMYLNAALINIANSNQEQKDFFFNQAIYVLFFCKNKSALKQKYYSQIEQ